MLHVYPSVVDGEGFWDAAVYLLLGPCSRAVRKYFAYPRDRPQVKQVQKRIKKHLDYRLHVKSVFDEAKIYTELSATLRDRINRYAYEEVTNKIDFLKDKVSGFVTLGTFTVHTSIGIFLLSPNADPLPTHMHTHTTPPSAFQSIFL